MTALERRRYGAEGRLVLQVTDEFCPWNEGVYELVGGEGDASCRRTGSEPDLVLSAGDLAAAYLGAVGFTTLAPWTPYNL